VVELNERANAKIAEPSVRLGSQHMSREESHFRRSFRLDGEVKKGMHHYCCHSIGLVRNGHLSCYKGDLQ
jgi:hypothetical protein